MTYLPKIKKKNIALPLLLLGAIFTSCKDQKEENKDQDNAQIEANSEELEDEAGLNELSAKEKELFQELAKLRS